MAQAMKAQKLEVEMLLRMALDLLDSAPTPDRAMLAAAPHIVHAIEILNPGHFPKPEADDAPS